MESDTINGTGDSKSACAAFFSFGKILSSIRRIWLAIVPLV